MKAISKVVAATAACALALGMFGCSSGTTTTTDASEATTYTSEDISAEDIAVQSSGYSLTTTETVDAEGNTVATPAVDYAFIVRNPNSGYVAQNVPFNVNGYNAAGEVVFSGGATCMYIYPGIDTAVSGTTTISAAEGVDTNITQFTVEPLLSTVEWLDTNLSDQQIADMFTVSGVSAERVESTLNVTASVTGDISYAEKIYKVADLEDTLEGHCVAIFYDAEGNILFGSDSTNVLIDQTTLDNAETTGEGEDAVQLNNVSVSISNAPEYADVELFVMPSL